MKAKTKTKRTSPATDFKSEKPHPLRAVPGEGQARWDDFIGRWVVGRTTRESLAHVYG